MKRRARNKYNQLIPPITKGIVACRPFIKDSTDIINGGTPTSESSDADGTIPRLWTTKLVGSATATEGRILGHATAGGDVGLLSEVARENLLTYSEQFDNVAWQKLSDGTGSNPVVTANAGTDPKGGTTADRMQFDRGAGVGAGDYSKLSQAKDTGVTPHTVSNTIYVKSYDGVSSYDMYLASISAGSESIITVTPEWQRVSMSAAKPAGTWNSLVLGLQGDLATDQTADILVWGAQLELGPAPTSYTPTVASSVTRSADIFQDTNVDSISTGLVAHLKLDESAGATAADATGNGHTGTLENMEDGDWGGAVDGNGLTFDGTNEIVSITHHADLTFGATDFSVAIWVKKLQASVGYDDIFAFTKWTNAGVDIANCEWALMMCNGDGDADYLNMSIGNGSTWYKAEWASAMTIGIWYRLLGVRDGNTLRLYVNGVQRATQDVTGVTMANPGTEVQIAGSAADNFWTKMEADDARIWNRALTVDEALRDYQGKSIRPSEGSIAIAVTPHFSGTDHGASAVILDARTADGDDGIKLDIDSSGNPHLLVRSGGADVASLTDAGYTAAYGTTFVAFVHWTTDSFLLQINERTAQTDTAGAAPNAMGKLNIGHDKDSAAQSMSAQALFVSYDRALVAGERSLLYNRYYKPILKI